MSASNSFGERRFVKIVRTEQQNCPATALPAEEDAGDDAARHALGGGSEVCFWECCPYSSRDCWAWPDKTDQIIKMNEKLPAPCEHCKATGLSHGSECKMCGGKGYR